MGEGVGLYEPIHGSAPDIAGQGIANPLAMISSTSMMLKYALHEEEASLKIDNAIKKSLAQGYRTADLSAYGAKEVCSCSEIGDIIAGFVSK
jgi:3-isopropylmalate dehydrogenase